MNERRPRGRPRPPETVERDRRILDCLRAGGAKSRNQLAEELELDKTIVYLALDRLRRQGLIRICADTAGPGAVWSAEVDSPCP
jgi:uncharacterized membrane protein